MERVPIDESGYARPDKCRFCGHSVVNFDWGQCFVCDVNGPMWICGADWRHFWVVDEHVHGPLPDRRPSWERGN